jgi:ribonuclease HI
MRVDMMRPAYYFEPKYRVTVLTREDWTKGTGTPPMIKGHVWFTDGSWMWKGTSAGVCGQSNRRRLSFSLGKHATVFQAEVFAILACAHDIKAHGIPEKHVSICSDSQAAPKAIGVVRTTSPLVCEYQEALNDISARHAVGLYWVPGHAGVRGNETANELARCSSALGFIGPELALGVSRQDLRNKISRWLGNQHWRCWQNLGNTQRQAQELISGPCRDTKIKLLSFNRIQSRVVTGLLTRYNTLQKHLHLLRLMDSPLCRKCAADDENSAHILCWCKVLASFRHAHLGSFFLEPENIKNISLGAIWKFSKAAGLP